MAKTLALMIAMTAVGVVGSPLAAMAQIPEEVDVEDLVEDLREATDEVIDDVESNIEPCVVRGTGGSGRPCPEIEEVLHPLCEFALPSFDPNFEFCQT